jgi:hypothetical protein
MMTLTYTHITAQMPDEQFTVLSVVDSKDVPLSAEWLAIRHTTIDSRAERIYGRIEFGHLEK